MLNKIKRITHYKWQILAASMALYAVMWFMSSASVTGVVIKQLVPASAPSISMPITLPYMANSQRAVIGDANYYSVKGQVYISPLSAADTLVIVTDNCPVQIHINDESPEGAPQFPVNMDCNFNNTQFLIPLSQSVLKQGKNTFEVIFEDRGGAFGINIETKSIWLKKSLLVVAPLLFIILMATALGATYKTLTSRINWAAVGLLVLGVMAITFSYGTLSQTYDEADHIAAGMQWWDRDAFTYDYRYMPLARIAGSALLYAMDITPTGDYRGQFINLGDRILHTDNAYIRNLTWARMGILPFYLLGGIIIFLWSRRLYGNNASLLSLAIYITSPMLTGHAGLVTTDFIYAACFITALYAFVLWIEHPCLTRSVFLGICTSLMLLSSTASLGQFTVAAALILEWHWFYLSNYTNSQKTSYWLYIKRLLLITIPCFAILIDAIYLFDNFQGFLNSISEAYNQNSYGQAVWLFGPLKNHAVWYYFPVASFFKTPIPFMLLCAAGIAYSFRRHAGLLYQHRAFFPILGALGVIMASTISNINNGSRYVLPFSVLLTIPAGYGLLRLLQSQYRPKQIFACVLVVWQLGAFVRIAPDYFTYFNEFALTPEKVLIDTDLDWGQDLLRLKKTLKEKNIEQITGCFFAKADIAKILDTQIDSCDYENANTFKGWVAISVYLVHLRTAAIPLEGVPYTRIGKSINLYYFE